MQDIVIDVLLVALFVIYLLFSIRYTISLYKSKIFSGKIKMIHFIMIWLVPIIWGWLLNNLQKTTPGSHEVEKKEDTKPFFDAYIQGE
ncbi:MAG: hypothetical protein QM768_08435 [Agriterribacter sp.]